MTNPNHDMTYSIEFDNVLATVCIDVAGPVRVARVIAMTRDGIKVSRQHNVQSFLIDYTDTYVDDSAIQTFDFMAHLSEHGLDRTLVIAIIFPEGDAEQHRFAETVARNRGWYNICYFATRDEAETWLRERRMEQNKPMSPDSDSSSR